jgi:hypothetical protein
MSLSQAESNVLVFEVSKIKIGFFLPEVQQLCVEDIVSPVPFSHPSLAGVLYQKESAPLPVFDLQSVLEDTVACPNIPGAQIVLVDAPTGAVGLRVHKLIGTRPIQGETPIEQLDDTVRSILPQLLRPAFPAYGVLPEIGRFFFFEPAIFLEQIDQDLAIRRAGS